MQPSHIRILYCVSSMHFLCLQDMGGQSSYRREWPRYTKGCDVICFVIDTQAPEDLAVAKKELHQLLEDRDLAVRYSIFTHSSHSDIVGSLPYSSFHAFCTVRWYVCCFALHHLILQASFVPPFSCFSSCIARRDCRSSCWRTRSTCGRRYLKRTLSRV